MFRKSVKVAFCLSAGLVMVLAGWPSSPARAEDGPPRPDIYESLTDEQKSETDTFAINNAIATVFHESGHMLVSEFKLPVLGKEEDAVDGLAALILLEAESANFNEAVMDSANIWFLAAGSADDDDEPAYWDEHSLDEQRAYADICWGLGKNKAAFKAFADSVNFPEDRADQCADDYKALSDNWNKVLEPHLAPEGRTTKFAISYDETDDPELAYYRKLIMDAKVLEMIPTVFSGLYAIQDDIRLTASECEEPNAFWDPEEYELTLCYNWVKYSADLNAQWYIDHPDKQ